MQYNYLASFLLFYTKINKFEWFKTYAYLQTMPIVQLPPKRFRFRHYESRKEIKTVFNFKEKVVRQEFDLLILEDQEFAFISNKERAGLVGNPEGSATLAAHPFAEKVITPLFLAEKVLVKESTCLLYGVHWQNYLIFYAEVPQNQIMLFIQQINAVPTVRRIAFGEKQPPMIGIIRKPQQSYHAQLQKYIFTFFQPILSQLFGSKQAQQLLKVYLPELRNLIEHHPETIKPIEGIYRDQIDFTLIMYFALSHTLKK